MMDEYERLAEAKGALYADSKRLEDERLYRSR